jgi:type I restriction enzyme M protein
MTDSRRLVDKLDSFRNLLRDDGWGCSTTSNNSPTRFLKMAHERATRKLAAADRAARVPVAATTRR